MLKREKDKFSIICNIENELKKPLPGIDFQLKMAPESRLRNLITVSENSKESGVLLLLYFKNELLTIVLIQRAINNGVHSGQISLPGGRFDENDIDLMYTSLRETYEEIGIHPSDVKILGKLTSLFIPVSNYVVYPFVGFCHKVPGFRLNVSEVSAVIEIPMMDFLKKNNQVTGYVEVRGNKYLVPFYKIGENQIWGATAMILSEFVQIINNIGIYD